MARTFVHRSLCAPPQVNDRGAGRGPLSSAGAVVMIAGTGARKRNIPSATIVVDSELSCPVLVARHMSASSGSVLPRGRGGQAEGLSRPSTGPRRTAAFEVLREAV